jgi:hypothetical protein
VSGGGEAGGGGALSRLLHELAEGSQGEDLTLRLLLRALGERGHAMIAFVLSVPFLQPIPLPGVSTLFGLAVAAVGLQLAIDRPPWLPRRLADRPLPRHTFVRLAHGAERLFRRFEHLVRPRLALLHAHPGLRRLSGGVLLCAGLLLALPLPIPASNFLPAFTIALVALGTLEEDGLLVVLGHASFAVTLAFFTALVVLPTLGLDLLRR